MLHVLRWPSAFHVHRGLGKQAVMLAQLLCELALLSHDLATGPRPSLVASAALCLSLACLRCGLWRDGSPGPSSSPEQYWTAAMAQATGYARAELGVMSRRLLDLHDVVCREHDAHGHSGGGAVSILL